MTDGRWTPDVQQRVAGYLDGFPHETWASDGAEAAETVLRILADAGALLAPGGDATTEYATVRSRRTPWDFVFRTTPEAALRTAKVWNNTAFAGQRSVIRWPDGTQLTGPWRLITDDERPTP